MFHSHEVYVMAVDIMSLMLEDVRFEVKFSSVERMYL